MAVTLFLCGDVMTGRGIDQALPHPGDPILYESWVKDARQYVELAERAHAPLRAEIHTCGAGLDLAEATTPAVLVVTSGARILVFGVGSETSGVPECWAATPKRAGVWLLPESTAEAASEVGACLRQQRRPGDVVVVSVHWGGNWGYDVPRWQTRLAHALVDDAGVDVAAVGPAD